MAIRLFLIYLERDYYPPSISNKRFKEMKTSKQDKPLNYM